MYCMTRTHALRASTFFILKKSNVNSYRVASFSIASFRNNNISSKDQREPSEQLTDQGTILALPEVHIKKSENGTTHYKLNDLGPVVINRDGSFGSIDNW